MGITRFAAPGRNPKQDTANYSLDLDKAAPQALANALYVEGAGAKNAYTGTTTAPVGKYFKGLTLIFKSGATTNDAASTLNLNGLGTKAIVTNANAALAGGEFVNGTVYVLVYDGTSFRIL